MVNVTLNESQQKARNILIEDAVIGYKSINNPTEIELALFRESIGVKIEQSMNRAAVRNSKDKRKERLELVHLEAAALGLKFIHNRVYEEVSSVVHCEQLSEKSKVEQVFKRDVPSTRGGETIAFSYRVDEQGDLYMDYSVAICRKDENFDPLIGMEVAIDKYNEGCILSEKITHNKLGPVKMGLMIDEFRNTEFDLS